ncbi:LysR family transcriptional regulator [Bradyrhizobium sp. U87765 SZCCT0131]|uniref:LysR substrate-binding domain-containing protein n=1 Tax=unclassified Bradyrhizobium TaxID=2631580 RepID=UPI001BAAD559|nr:MULTISPECIES: LysR substrate-binding domain-containing protein [unclassified Bradyrhizobium]MBR1222254.1 LysR family transcriptional regulator [Bradyrhizobium sp. U87765 SZCCT0131]MBR1264262.1 LysR family transcriptional regulator [Bradyrhizobium sp. U87765 SZCCT0134]MBR1307955.1 LysR family transcriptional regulator [Bradyrhizobium sp. U87765 SZCCT0110]MBR1320512.1 LysR family transcriptional regulator [Bradyrhizobium sp. U87765 SZCCT0109]MBR1348375.1 LysR family transcriptional regulator 
MSRVNLDMDVLRTLVTTQQFGSFNRAADHIGRSQSAVSQQIRKLEEQVGEPLFHKQGRHLVLTDAGELMLAYARRILDLNDEAVAALHGRAVEGQVRFGLPADFAETWLPTALGRFRRSHPAVRIDAVVDRNRRLLERLDNGELDLVLAIGSGMRSDAAVLAPLPLVWIGAASANTVWPPDEPLPLAMYEAPCFFRQRALAALDAAGVRWRIAFTSPSLHGLWAAVAAGLGVTLRTAVGLPSTLRVIDDGLPAIAEGALPVCLHDGGRALAPTLAALRATIVATVAENLPA